MINSTPKNSTGIRMSARARAAVAISSPSPKSRLPMSAIEPRFDTDSEAIARPRGRLNLGRRVSHLRPTRHSTPSGATHASRAS